MIWDCLAELNKECADVYKRVWTNMTLGSQGRFPYEPLAFLNSSMLHTVSWKNEPESKTCYTFFFDRSILTGEYGSIFEEKYVTPLTMCRSLDIYPIRPRDKAGLRMMTLIDDIIGYFKNEEFGYEMKSRSALSELWLILLKETEELRENARKADPTDSQRMKQMMNYVHEHYRDKI